MKLLLYLLLFCSYGVQLNVLIWFSMQLFLIYFNGKEAFLYLAASLKA